MNTCILLEQRIMKEIKLHLLILCYVEILPLGTQTMKLEKVTIATEQGHKTFFKVTLYGL